MNEMQVAERKVLRGDVIEKLYQNYGTDIMIAVLKNYLRIRGFVTEEELQKAIYYLGGEGKRYIHVEVNKDNWLDGTIWLTPAGVNLAILRIWGSSSMNEILNVAGKEIVRREIMELCREAEPYGAGTPVLKAALRKTGHDLTDQELMRQVDYLEGKGLVHKEMVENRRLGISRCISGGQRSGCCGG